MTQRNGTLGLLFSLALFACAPDDDGGVEGSPQALVPVEDCGVPGDGDGDHGDGDGDHGDGDGDGDGDGECPEEVFGDLVGNPLPCNGASSNNVPVHLRGDFGDSADLEISGPGGFVLDVTMRRAGNSCNYQYNWATRDGNGGPGTYSFQFTGENGATLNFVKNLACPTIVLLRDKR